MYESNFGTSVENQPHLSKILPFFVQNVSKQWALCLAAPYNLSSCTPMKQDSSLLSPTLKPKLKIPTILVIRQSIRPSCDRFYGPGRDPSVQSIGYELYCRELVFESSAYGRTKNKEN